LSDQSPFDEIYAVDVMVLGIGCTLYSDEGFGVRVVEKMQQEYEFPDSVLLVDGGVLGAAPDIWGHGQDAMFKSKAGVNRGTTGQGGDVRDVE